MDEPSASPTIDLSGISGAWCFAYLALPEAAHAEARRAVVLNLLVNPDGSFPSGWEKTAPRLLAFLNGEVRDNVAPFPKPRLMIDNDKPL